MNCTNRTKGDIIKTIFSKSEADLLLAAPAMYEALKEVLDNLENKLPSPICSSTNTEQKILRKALYKAEGKDA
jgi:hypothetical protein